MKQTFDIKGMTCAACVSHVEKAARKAAGVTGVQVNLMNGTAVIEGDYDTRDVCRCIHNAGYEAQLPGENGVQTKENGQQSMKKRLLWSFVFLLFLMYTAMGEMLGLPLPAVLLGESNALVSALIQILLVTPILYLNKAYYERGFKALVHMNPNMDSLVAVGSAAAFIYGLWSVFGMAYGFGHGDMALVAQSRGQLYFESAGMILTLVTVGKTLESRAKKKTGEAVEKLKTLVPDTVSIIRNGKEEKTNINDVRTEDLVLLRPGQRVPVDGIITEGNCTTDESALTGESMPVYHTAGDTLMAGSVVTDKQVVIRATRVGQDTTLNTIIRMVTDASMTKPPMARIADRAAGIFVPVVMGIALLTLIVWLLSGRAFSFAVNKMISVLVISCPCALGLATPVAVTVGIGRGAASGILFRSAEAIETLGKTTVAVMDKTGTVTLGKPEVQGVAVLCRDEKRLFSIARTLENGSAHPLAKAVCEKAADAHLMPVCDLTEVPGLGVKGNIDGHACFAGSSKWIGMCGVKVPYDGPDDAGTKVYVAEDTALLGYFTVSDPIREDSAEAIHAMQEAGLRTVLLTGDDIRAAQPIARQAGIEDVIANVLPADKEKQIAMLMQKGERVLMIGDGINDAPALSRADVGMAIGAGSDIAVDAADTVLMRSSLKDAVMAVRLSRAVTRNIRQNLFWAFFYNMICIPLAAGVLENIGIGLSPMIGSACMSMSSVCVCLNALRLRFGGKAAIPAVCECKAPETETVRVILTVKGMMCTHCESTVKEIIASFGAEDIAVSHEKGTAVFSLPRDTDMEKIMQAIRDEDYETGEWILA